MNDNFINTFKNTALNTVGRTIGTGKGPMTSGGWQETIDSTFGGTGASLFGDLSGAWENVKVPLATALMNGAFGQLRWSKEGVYLPILGPSNAFLATSLYSFLGAYVAELGRPYNLYWWDLVDYFSTDSKNYVENEGKFATTGKTLGVPLHAAFMTEAFYIAGGNTGATIFLTTTAFNLLSQSLLLK
jgi:hypothetical protein